MRIRWRPLAVCAALATAALTHFGIAPALAYEARAVWEEAKPNKGVKAAVYVRSGYAADWRTGGHINEAVWTGTDEAKHFENWIEVGYTWGYRGSSGLTWYWARQRPDKPYADWDLSAPISTGSWYWLRIQYLSNDSWGVYIDGDQQATCSPVTPDGNVNSESLAAGLESTSAASYLGSGFDYPACAVSKLMQYWRLSEGIWYWGLVDSGGVYGHATITGHVDSGAGMHAQWLYEGSNDYSNLHSWKVVP